jgi:hypothetical protein
MERSDVAYLINSTPKYYYLLEIHLELLYRYAPSCKWPIYFATENPDDTMCKLIKQRYNVNILTLENKYSSFINSRARALELLPNTIKYVLPMQEDFLLERFIDVKAIEESLILLESMKNLISIRYMPCPGPKEINSNYNKRWKYIDSKYDTYLFTYQATLWKRNECLLWFSTLVKEVVKKDPLSFTQQIQIEVENNIAENSEGQKVFHNLFKNKIILGYIRAHKYPNAVYMSPWPYRPTAVIKGVLQPFAKELALREGINI